MQDVRSKIVSFLSQKGILVEPEALEDVLSKRDPEEYIRTITGRMEIPIFLDRSLLRRFEGAEPSAPPSIVATSIPSEQKIPLSFTPPAEQQTGDIRIIKDVTQNITSTGSIQDFVSYFRDRYSRTKSMLRERPAISGSIPIKSLNNLKNSDEIKFVGMVSDIRITKNGHYMLTFEDDTGTIDALAPKGDEKIFSIAGTLLKDEVVGVIGRFSSKRDLFIARDILRPEVPNAHTEHRAGTSVYAAFISDVHVGSKTFLKKEWDDFIRWINGNVDSPRERDVVGRIKYLIISGDLVDGIGIYPNQEDELEIHDIYQQYQEFVRMMDDVPEHINIVLQPGNHDAVRLAEPQPTFPEDIRKMVKRRNISFVGNPSYFSIHGVEVLSYHGRSMDDMIPAMKLTWHDPIGAMKGMLQRRHLAPVYGGKNQLAPEKTDYMIIDNVPDIFVTGHVHASAVENYKGILLINASAWQSQTSYQMKMGIKPDPCKVVLVDLKTMQYTIKGFGE